MDGRVNGRVNEWMDLWLWENGWVKFYWAQIRPSEKDSLLSSTPYQDDSINSPLQSLR